MNPPEEPSRSVVRLSPEVSESSPTSEIITQTAPQLAALINKFWPQTTIQDGGKITHYVLTGSLGVALLAGATELSDENGTQKIPQSAKGELMKAVHLIHDIDHVRRDYPWPDVFDPLADQFNKDARRLPAVAQADLSFDDLHTYTSEGFVTVRTSTGDYIISRPDSAAAYKLLSVLFSNIFLNKPYQLNIETPSLIKAAVNIYSEEVVWKRIIDVFRAYDTHARGHFSEYETVAYMLPRALQDPCLSPELKALVNKAVELSGTKI